MIDCLVAAKSNWSNKIDALCGQVEQIAVLGLPIAESAYTVTSVETTISVDEEKAVPIAMATIQIVYSYIEQKEVDDGLSPLQGTTFKDTNTGGGVTASADMP
ncbi:MAG: hypothetical protein COA62_15690 [Rhodobiaceae bacterium]|nr:MAG: hypothetical protein COA62_15690 [Rhodobiaceae bacterium]